MSSSNMERSFFGVRFCLGKELTSELDSWVRFASRKGVKKLIINLSCGCRSATSGTYVFRPELLSDAKEFKITQLMLESCISGHGLFDKFHSLQDLEFNIITLNEQDVESILPCCMKLETLVFNRCDLPAKLCISGRLVLQLKILKVFDCIKTKEIQPSAPNLTCMQYAGNVIKFSFLEVPNLKSFDIVDCGGTAGLYFVQLFKSAAIEKA